MSEKKPITDERIAELIESWDGDADDAWTFAGTTDYEMATVLKEFQRLRSDNEQLRAARCAYDCRMTPGDVADLSGSHCPLDRPCLRCQNERLAEDNAKLAKVADAAESFVHWHNGANLVPMSRIYTTMVICLRDAGREVL